ncbi:hypothetical protein [Piscinibacter sakaiensis]|uniref:hypothetical protein n=1 Tax=Piscinibacter sakaiensis TaxID=1547922 RepID=UPI003AAB6578
MTTVPQHSLLALLCAALTGCGGVITTTAPIRVADIDVTAGVSPARCDGSFDGSGRITATWPAPPPNGKAAAVSTITKLVPRDVSFNYTPDRTEFGATRPDRTNLTITNGSLSSVCRDGTFQMRATTRHAVRPPRLDTEDDSPLVTVNQVGFKIASQIGVDIRTARDFDVKFTLSCCGPPAAGVWKVDVVSATNVLGDTLSWNPDPPRLTCPGPDVAFVGRGKKRDTAPMATVQLKVQKVAGNACALGTAIVEGN